MKNEMNNEFISTINSFTSTILLTIIMIITLSHNYNDKKNLFIVDEKTQINNNEYDYKIVDEKIGHTHVISNEAWNVGDTLFLSKYEKTINEQ